MSGGHAPLRATGLVLLCLANGVWAQEASDDGAPPPRTERDGPTKADDLGWRAYEQGLAARKLASSAPLSAARLREELARAEEALLHGRIAEAISAAAALTESERFAPFQESAEGRGIRFVLGEALGRAGAYAASRKYLAPLVQGNDVPARRAVRALVDFGLESGDPALFLEALDGVESRLPDDLRGDVAYARGRSHEKAGRFDEALASLAKVGPRSRFWAQATYLSGLIEAQRGRLKQAEDLFCRVADPKRTPKEAPIFGGGDFFEVRDLARLGLGRVAHEAYRFDDAQYYYYLVPKDSKYLPEALYEAATTRYEAKDHDGARDYLEELATLEQSHPYEDERFILDAYVDLASCRFDSAEEKLKTFLHTYVPVLNATRRLRRDPEAMRRLLDAVDQDGDPSFANLGIDEASARRLVALLRVDEDQRRVSRRLARLNQQIEGLDQVHAEFDSARAFLAGKTVTNEQAVGELGRTPADRLHRLESQAAEIGRLLREAEATKKVSAEEIRQLRGELESLLIRVAHVRASTQGALDRAKGADLSLDDQIRGDQQRLEQLRAQALAARESLQKRAQQQAQDVLKRLDLRLERLVRRARMGRIELILGKKRALEVEIEALSQGLLPPSMVDSLDVARYLRDDEEYWPDDGEDWADEYVGGEGLRSTP